MHFTEAYIGIWSDVRSLEEVPIFPQRGLGHTAIKAPLLSLSLIYIARLWTCLFRAIYISVPNTLELRAYGRAKFHSDV